MQEIGTILDLYKENNLATDWLLEERKKRHRGAYKKELSEFPFELSRSTVEKFIKCPKCFYNEKFYGVKPPSIPGFLLNSNTDTLLKKDFDQYRGRKSHPIMLLAGLEHLVPFAHEDIENWEDSLHFGLNPNKFNTLHRETNILFGGGLDDVWQNQESGELHIVDYKSTAQMGKNPKPLDESFIAPPLNPKKIDYKASYRRQMDMYQWIMRRKGFDVSSIGYFVYVDGQHLDQMGMIDENDPTKAFMEFKTSIIPYQGDDSWVENTLFKIKDGIEARASEGSNFSHISLSHSEDCELGKFITEEKRISDT
ncbi:hypothetical protein OAL54_01575 [Gammaproteobacteria bacterium]|nr:hypothetical protein [Gammaproteobacteria bacterium]